jgi:hypothetical protein
MLSAGGGGGTGTRSTSNYARPEERASDPLDSVNAISSSGRTPTATGISGGGYGGGGGGGLPANPYADLARAPNPFAGSASAANPFASSASVSNPLASYGNVGNPFAAPQHDAASLGVGNWSMPTGTTLERLQSELPSMSNYESPYSLTGGGADLFTQYRDYAARAMSPPKEGYAPAPPRGGVPGQTTTGYTGGGSDYRPTAPQATGTTPQAGAPNQATLLRQPTALTTYW